MSTQAYLDNVENFTEWELISQSNFENEVLTSGPHEGELTGWQKPVGRDWPRWNFLTGVIQKDPYTVPVPYVSFGESKKNSRRTRFTKFLRSIFS